MEFENEKQKAIQETKALAQEITNRKQKLKSKGNQFSQEVCSLKTLIANQKVEIDQLNQKLLFDFDIEEKVSQIEDDLKVNPVNLK